MDFLGVYLILCNLILLCNGSIDVSGGTMEGYFTPSEVWEYLHSTVTQNVELVNIGNTYLSKDIYALHLNKDKPIKVLVLGAHHAHELISVTQVLYIVDKLFTSTDPSIAHLKETAEFWFVPIVNLDSYDAIAQHYSEFQKILELRKNMRNNSCDTYGQGVDINRNYGYKWGFDDIGSSDNICGEDYRGEYAFSEPETQAIQDLFRQHNFTLAVSYHSWGNLYVHPFGYSNQQDASMYRSPDDLEFYRSLRDVIPMNSELGTPYDLLDYTANGAFVDYAYSEGAISMTIEVGNEFHPPKRQISGIVNSHGNTFFKILERVLPALNVNIEYVRLNEELLSISFKMQNTGLSAANETQAEFWLSNNFTINTIVFEDRYGYTTSPHYVFNSSHLDLTIPSINRLDTQYLNLILSIEDYQVNNVQFALKLSSDQTFEGSAKAIRELPDSTEEDDDDETGVNKNAAIGITIALIVLIIGTVIATKYYIRHKRTQNPQFQGFEQAADPRIITIPVMRDQNVSPNQIFLQEKKEVFTID